MLRTFAVAIALVAFAGAATADCGDDHSAKEALTPDQQANASRIPATSKNVVHATSKATGMRSPGAARKILVPSIFESA